MFDHVIVTGDLLRPFPDGGGGWESATWKNVRWLWSLLGPAIGATGRHVGMLAWDEHMDPRHGRFFDTPALYAAAGLTPSPEAWTRLAGRDAELPPGAWQPLLDAAADGLVVGYEMPDSMIAALAGAGVAFVDVVLHPVRFLDDLVFALRTNVEGLHRGMLPHAVAEERVLAQAAMIRAKTAWMARPLQTPPGTALVLGQVGDDRALARPGGGFRSLGDHLDRLHQLCCDHSRVLFKPHPYDRPDSPSRRAIAALPAIGRVEGNFYHLLGQPEIERVVALNSSGLTEAPYFGKAAEALAPPLYAFGGAGPSGDGMPGEAVALDGAWTEAWFWRAVLDGAEPVSAPPLPANRLRRAMNADWGYGFMERVVA